MDINKVLFGFIPEFEIKSMKIKGFKYIIIFNLYPRRGGDDYYRWFYSKIDPKDDSTVITTLQTKVLPTAQIIDYRVDTINNLNLTPDN